jgi:hypothetical protein
LPTASEVEINTSPKGFVLNVETLFPEWTGIETENWSEVPDTLPDSPIPSHLGAVATQKLKAYLKLDSEEDAAAVDPKKGKAAPAKKGKGEAPPELADSAVDENGKPLPRVYINKTPQPVDSTSYNPGRDLLLNRFQRVSVTEALNSGTPGRQIGDDEARETMSPVPPRKLRAPGPEIDHLMSSVFYIIDRYAPSIISTTSSSDSGRDTKTFPFLWNAIYPQTAAGVPCYNPAGKYCVKLFLGGKWRKITVRDSVPVRNDGLCALTSSVDSLELWPMLLSKAVYAAFIACGYEDIIPDPVADTIVAGSDLAKSSSMTSAAFVGFALHLLTGWQPGSSWDIRDLIALDASRANLLLQEMLFGGAALIDPTQIPKEIPKPTVLFNNKATITSTSIDDAEPSADGDVASGTLMLTKKLFKAEYRRRHAEKTILQEAIQSRETMIQNIQAAIDRPYSECFFVSVPAVTPSGEATTEVLPVLGLSYETKEDGVQPLDLGAVQLLVAWRITGSELDTVTPTLYTGNPSFNPTAKGDIKDAELSDINKPLQPSTTTEFRFVSLNELRDKGTIFLGLDTLLRHNSRVSLGWHWKPVPAPVDPAANAKGGKAPAKPAGGKKGEVAAVVPDTEILCQDAGHMPPSVLAILPQSFFGEQSEVEAALAQQAQQLGSRPGSRTEIQTANNAGLVAKSSHLSLSVLIHADMVKIKNDQVGSPTAESPSRPGTSQNAAEGAAPASRSGSVVLVLQELTWGPDSLDPLVMRVELSETALMPLTRVTFHIPADRIAANVAGDSVAPMVFWVRLFSDASVYLNFCCSTELTVGNMEDVCSSLGFQLIVREGQATPTIPSTEQVLFRCPLVCDTGSAESEVEDPSGVMSFLYVESKPISRCLSLVLHSNTATDSQCLFRTQGALLAVSNKQRLLLGRCYPMEESASVPSFRWKLLILSQSCTSLVADAVPQSIGCTAVENRFVGAYTPNNRLLLFRDRVTVNKLTFPLALRFSTGKLPPPSARPATAPPSEAKPPGSVSKKMTKSPSPVPMDTGLNANSVTSVGSGSLVEDDAGSVGGAEALGIDSKEDIWLVLRVINKYTRNVLAEYRGKSILTIYDVALEQCAEGFVPDDAAGNAKDKKGAASTKKGGKAPTTAEEPLDIIIECCLDESAMEIPPQWRSRLPYSYPYSVPGYVPPPFDGSLNDIAPSKPQFQWQLDYLCGSVMSASHDTYDTERFTAQKNSWESGSEGRTERALAALTYYRTLIAPTIPGSKAGSRSTSPQQVASDLSRPPSQATLQPSSALNKEQLLNSLAAALGKTNTELTQRVDFLETSKPVSLINLSVFSVFSLSVVWCYVVCGICGLFRRRVSVFD